MKQPLGDHSMKKSLIMLAALGAFSAVAHAQSSVTLYGLIDAGVAYVNNDKGKPLVAAESGQVQGSRWGLKGSEDLGGGLTAVFDLENGYNVYTGALGQGGDDFGRQAWVGLSSSRWGRVTLGRQYDTVTDYIQPITMNGIWGEDFSHAGDIDNTDNSLRINNAAKYTSPSYNGLTFGGMYAFGGVAGEFGENSMFGLGTQYSNGAINVAVVYEHIRSPQTNTGAPFVANNANPTLGGPFGYVGDPANAQYIAVGGTYNFGPAKVGVDYTNVKFGNANGTTSSVTFNNAELWGQYALTPAATLIAGYTYTGGKVNYAIATGNRPTWNQFNLMLDYALSKRTDVYVQGIFMKGSGGAVADNVAAVSSSENQVVLNTGIRLKF
jgi:predicted porin